MQRLRQWIRRVPRPRINPMIVKEMRAHMRGPRAFVILVLYLLGLALFSYGLYRIILAGASAPYMLGGMQSALIGQGLFISLAFLEMLLVCFVTPALTAGTISGEYERSTYDLLLATGLRPARILWGKTVPALTYVLLLIVATIPISSIIFLFGGVEVLDMLQAIALLGLVAITYGMLGVFFSALVRRTGRATVLSYIVVLLLVLGSTFGWMAAGALNMAQYGLGGGGPYPTSGGPQALLYVNPFSALVSAVMPVEAVGQVFSMGPGLSILFYFAGGTEILGLYATQPAARPLWQYTVAIYLAATMILYLVTTQLVKPVRRWRVGWRGAAVALLVLLLIAGGLYVTFGTRWGSTGAGMTGGSDMTEPFLMREVEFGIAPAPAVVVPLETPTPLPPPTLGPGPEELLLPPNVAPSPSLPSPGPGENYPLDEE